MGPKKGTAAAAASSPVPEAPAAAANGEAGAEGQEETPEPEILKRCLRAGSQLYHGDCKAGTRERKGTFVRHGTGQQVNTAVTPAGCRFSNSLAYETVIMGLYDGSWEEDAMSGQGNYKWCDGSSYEGNIANGLMHGHGIFNWPDGTSYRGAWQMGMMHGQGRFDSRFDGRFLQGRFHRSCFQNKDRRWVDVLDQVKREEQTRIQEGDPSSLQVRRCTFGEVFAEGSRSQLVEEQRQAFELAITSAQQEGLVPLVVADDSLGGSGMDCLQRAGLLPDGLLQCASVRLAAIAKRRKRDHHRFFYDPIVHTLKKGLLFVLAFEDDTAGIKADQDEDPEGFWFGQKVLLGDPGCDLPEDWRLVNFFRPCVLPIEIFNPVLFNGRVMARYFLPEDAAEAFGPHLPPPASAAPAAKAPAPPSATPPPPATADSKETKSGRPTPSPKPPSSPEVAEAEEEEKASLQAAMALAAAAAAKNPEGKLGLSGHFFEPGGGEAGLKEAGLPVLHCLRPAVATRAFLPSGLGDSEVRQQIMQRYHRHVPLHQSVVVLLTKRATAEDPELSG